MQRDRIVKLVNVVRTVEVHAYGFKCTVSQALVLGMNKLHNKKNDCGMVTNVFSVKSCCQFLVAHTYIHIYSVFI